MQMQSFEPHGVDACRPESEFLLQSERLGKAWVAPRLRLSLDRHRPL